MTYATWMTGNRLWEWWSVGRYGTGGYDFKNQKFAGEEWPEVSCHMHIHVLLVLSPDSPHARAHPVHKSGPAVWIAIPTESRVSQ